MGTQIYDILSGQNYIFNKNIIETPITTLNYTSLIFTGDTLNIEGDNVIYLINSNIGTGNTITINLPNISENNNLILYIKDVGFNSSVNNIIIKPYINDFIENNENKIIIALDGTSITMCNNNINNWYII